MNIKQLKEIARIEIDAKEKSLMTYANKYRLGNGLMPDEYKTEEYWKLKKDFDLAFSKLRQINTLNKALCLAYCIMTARP